MNKDVEVPFNPKDPAGVAAALIALIQDKGVVVYTQDVGTFAGSRRVSSDRPEGSYGDSA